MPKWMASSDQPGAGVREEVAAHGEDVVVIGRGAKQRALGRLRSRLRSDSASPCPVMSVKLVVLNCYHESGDVLPEVAPHRNLFDLKCVALTSHVRAELADASH